MSVQLPLVGGVPNYRVGTAFGDTQVILDVRWNARDGAWYLDILAEDETPMARGIKIVLGALLGYRSTDPRLPAGALLASDLSGAGADATLDDLGTRVAVYYFAPDEL